MSSSAAANGDDAMETEPANVTKEEVLRWADQKTAIEAELGELYAVLKSQGASMDEALVDAQGFPRSDIDVYQVRRARSRINELRNDLRAAMDRIEAGLHDLHRQTREGVGARSPEELAERTGGAAGAQDLPECFVKVNLVSSGSPADVAGLKVGDQMAQFGTITAANFTDLNGIGQMVRNSRDQALPVRVVRGGRVVRLNLTPRSWAGQGLLGCNILPIEKREDVVDR